MIRLIVVYFLSDKYMADTFSPLFYHVKTKKFFPCLVFCVQLVETETIILCATLTQVQKECLSRLQLILCLECKYSTIENNQGSNHFFNLKIFFMNPIFNTWLRRLVVRRQPDRRPIAWSALPSSIGLYMIGY